MDAFHFADVLEKFSLCNLAFIAWQAKQHMEILDYPDRHTRDRETSELQMHGASHAPTWNTNSRPVSNALQWRLQYGRVIEQAGKVPGVLRLV